LDAHAFVKCHNPAALALASRMNFDVKERFNLTRDFFLNLAVTTQERAEQEIVVGFFSTCQPLRRREALQLLTELDIVKSYELREKVMHLRNPFIELGIEQGRHKGEIDVVLRQLIRRLGTLPVSQKKRIEKLDLKKIEALAESLLDFTCRTDPTRWLKQNAS